MTVVVCGSKIKHQVSSMSCQVALFKDCPESFLAIFFCRVNRSSILVSMCKTTCSPWIDCGVQELVLWVKRFVETAANTRDVLKYAVSAEKLMAHNHVKLLKLLMGAENNQLHTKNPKNMKYEV